MGYCSISDVKKRLPEIKDTSYDTELTDLIEEIDSEIDNALQNHTTVPLASPPTIIKHISANWAAGKWQRRRTPSSEAHVFEIIAKEMLADYIAETYKEATLKRV